jgi:hypothetical protein
MIGAEHSVLVLEQRLELRDGLVYAARLTDPEG